MYPRAWVVHDARGLPPMNGLTRAERSGPMQEILYGDDPIWHDPKLTRTTLAGWCGSKTGSGLHCKSSWVGDRPGNEKVRVAYPNPQRVELDVTLDSPGIVVLADVAYPGGSSRSTASPHLCTR